MLWIRAAALFSCYQMSQPSFTTASQAGGWVAGPHRGELFLTDRATRPGIIPASQWLGRG